MIEEKQAAYAADDERIGGGVGSETGNAIADAKIQGTDLTWGDMHAICRMLERINAQGEAVGLGGCDILLAGRAARELAKLPLERPAGESSRIGLEGRGMTPTCVGHSKYGEKFRSLQIDFDVDDILLAKGIPAEYCRSVWLSRPKDATAVISAKMVVWLLGVGPEWEGRSDPPTTVSADDGRLQAMLTR